MRVALLSMLEDAGDPGEGKKAFIPFVGKTVARRQIEFVLDLGCERIVCLAENLGSALISLQHQVEAAGARFHVISSPQALSGLVKAADELVIVEDGVLPLAHEARQILSDGAGVLVLPAESGIPRGFERVDLSHAWAGALIMPGRLVERLNELPRDCNGIASLLRIALQARVPERSLSDSILSEGRWAKLDDSEQVGVIERLWFSRHAKGHNPWSVGPWLAGRIVGRFGLAMLNRNLRPGMVLAAAGALLGVSLCLGWYRMAGLGLLLLALSQLAAGAAVALSRADGGGDQPDSKFGRGIKVFTAAFDVSLVTLIAAGIEVRLHGWPERLFVPLTLIGLMLTIPRMSQSRWAAVTGDRMLIAIALGFAALFQILLPVAQLLALALVGCGIAFSQGKAKLTQV